MGGHRGAVWIGTALSVVALVGCGATTKPASKTTSTPTAIESSEKAHSAAVPIATANPTGVAPAPPAASTSGLPVSISIPAIGVQSGLQKLGLQPDGTLQSPSEWQRAGWYSGGVRPGDPGPAVIVGHVDSVSGPAVFFRLKELAPGNRVIVAQTNGRTLTFAVDTIQEYPKNQFPTQAVYGPTAVPVLRLVTCTGDFDRAAHSYVDNLVVSSHLIG